MINIRKINATTRIVNYSRLILALTMLALLVVQAGSMSTGEISQFSCQEIKDAVRDGENLRLGGWMNQKASSFDLSLYYTTQCIEDRCIKIGGRGLVTGGQEKNETNE